VARLADAVPSDPKEREDRVRDAAFTASPIAV
jgi:hypothetical protein